MGKPIEYVWAWIIGGLIAVLAQLAIMFWRAVGISNSWSVTCMLGTMAVFGVIMAVLGFAKKWEEKSIIGAYMPFTGAAIFAVECYYDGLMRGERGAKAHWSGIKTLWLLYGRGILTCMAIAIIVFIRV